MSPRRATTLKPMKDNCLSTALIIPYLKSKYKSEEEWTLDSLIIAQTENLYSKIKEKIQHQKLYRCKANEMIDIENSSLCLKNGIISSKDEGRLAYLQDRNMFGSNPGKCPHCKERFKTVDHLATQCKQMLGHDYTRRHNEVVRCIHLFLCNKYGIKRTNKLRTYSVQEITAKSEVEIRVDTPIATSNKISANRPDIVVHRKKVKNYYLLK